MAEPARLRDVSVTIGGIELPIKELSFRFAQKQHAERDHRRLLEVTAGISRGESVTCTGKVTLVPRRHPRCTALVTIPDEEAHAPTS